MEAVRIIRDKTTSIGKGFGYVLFSSKESVPLALTMDGRLFNGRVRFISHISIYGEPRKKKKEKRIKASLSSVLSLSLSFSFSFSFSPKNYSHIYTHGLIF